MLINTCRNLKEPQEQYAKDYILSDSAPMKHRRDTCRDKKQTVVPWFGINYKRAQGKLGKLQKYSKTGVWQWLTTL